MFNKYKNELSLILYKYKDYIDYNSIKNDKLRYSIKAQLNGKLHMKRLYLDNMPSVLKHKLHKLEYISKYKYKWGLKEQETFIKESDWYKETIIPLIIYDEDKTESYKRIFPNNITQFELGQLRFTRYNQKDCIFYILAYLFFYNKKLYIEQIFNMVEKLYPIRYKRKYYRKEDVLLNLVKLAKSGCISCYDLTFSANEMFFNAFVKFVEEK